MRSMFTKRVVKEGVKEAIQELGAISVDITGIESVRIADTTDTVINPATKELQQLILAQLDVKLSDILGTGSKTITDVDARLSSILAQLDVKLSEFRDSILSLFSPVSASDTIAAASNTSGLEVALDTGGRPYVEVFVSTSDAATIEIYASTDGATWRLIETVTLSSAGTYHDGWFNAYRWVKVKVPTTNIDITIEITASR